MEENQAAAFESIWNGDHYDAASTAANDYNTHHTTTNNDHGWQKVTAKRPRKKKESNAETINNQNKLVPGVANANGNGVFRSLEKQSEDWHRRILEAQRANVDLNDVAPARSKLRSDDEDGDNSDDEFATQNVKAEEAKKSKPKMPNKPKVTVAEAAAKIDEANDLKAFLIDILASYESKEDIQLMRFAILSIISRYIDDN